RDGGGRPGVPLVRRAGPGIARQQRQHPAAQRPDRAQRARYVLGREQLGSEDVGQLLVERGEVAGGGRRVVREVVLDVDHDHQRCVVGVRGGPGGDGPQPGAQVVRRGVAGVVDLVAGGVVADGVVLVRGVAVVVVTHGGGPDQTVGPSVYLPLRSVL